MARTKIVATIGPSSGSDDMLQRLVEAGMRVARLNFSHGTHEEHRAVIETIRDVSARMGIPVAILQDLQGPKIRVGKIREPGLVLRPGERLVLSSRPRDDHEVEVTYERFSSDVEKGDRILLADGLLELQVIETEPERIITRVVTGGVLTSNKGINLPERSLAVASLTEKDKRDLDLGISMNLDYIALSFVRGSSDIETVKGMINKAGSDIPVIAKIEKHEAIRNIDEILDAADGVMVARGDLGVEIPLEEVPSVQKMIVKKANAAGKPVIIATQMLRSMVDSPRPTRAEATDVANGVLDGADAVMLSEETAVGKYPVEAVRYMEAIIRSAEKGYPHQKYVKIAHPTSISDSVAFASVVMADRLEASAIIATTRSGLTAKMVSAYRPRCRIIALSPDEKVVRRLALCWGCLPVLRPLTSDTDKLIDNATDSAVSTGLVSTGDLVIITAGRPVWEEGTTNMLWVKEI